jgi:hypothetical protein
MRECTSFVLWHCCLLLHNALADHDSSCCNEVPFDAAVVGLNVVSQNI